MHGKIEKQKIWKLTGAFFAAMAAFTLLSRAAYQHGIAVVATQAPAGGTISHQVVLTGKTVQNQEQAVTTEAGLRIAGVYVNEGQQVKQGDVLFSLDLDYLDEEILNQKQEMQMFPDFWPSLPSWRWAQVSCRAFWLHRWICACLPTNITVLSIYTISRYRPPKV